MSSKKTTVTDRVLHALRNGEHITQFIAWPRFGTMRLADVIWRLKKKTDTTGKLWDIREKKIEVYNRWEDSCLVSEYWLVSSQLAKRDDGTDSFDFGGADGNS